MKNKPLLPTLLFLSLFCTNPVDEDPLKIIDPSAIEGIWIRRYIIHGSFDPTIQQKPDSFSVTYINFDSSDFPCHTYEFRKDSCYTYDFFKREGVLDQCYFRSGAQSFLSNDTLFGITEYKNWGPVLSMQNVVQLQQDTLIFEFTFDDTITGTTDKYFFEYRRAFFSAIPPPEWPQMQCVLPE